MKDPTRAPFFACLYPGLCDTARKHGYALTIHGTVTSDLDLVAIPWIDGADSPVALVQALRDHIGAVDYHNLLKRDCAWATEQMIHQMVANQEAEQSGSVLGAASKPHGRLTWNLYMDAGAKVDLSVMPRFAAAEKIAPDAPRDLKLPDVLSDAVEPHGKHRYVVVNCHNHTHLRTGDIVRVLLLVKPFGVRRESRCSRLYCERTETLYDPLDELGNPITLRPVR